MAVAEKYRARRGFKYSGRRFEMGEPIDRSYIINDGGETKLRVLQRAGFIELDPVTRPLDKMTKADLIEYGREVGADVQHNMTKTDLLAAIKQEL